MDTGTPSAYGLPGNVRENRWRGEVVNYFATPLRNAELTDSGTFYSSRCVCAGPAQQVKHQVVMKIDFTFRTFDRDHKYMLDKRTDRQS